MERIMDPGAYAVDFLTDVRYIEKHFGLSDTYSFDREYVDLEIYRVMLPETLATLAFALIAVILVVLFITVNF